MKKGEYNPETGDAIKIMFRKRSWCQSGMTWQGKEVYIKPKDLEAILKDKENYPYDVTDGMGVFCKDYVYKQLGIKNDPNNP